MKSFIFACFKQTGTFNILIVNLLVSGQVVCSRARKGTGSDITDKRLLTRVSLRVFCQVTGLGTCIIAQVTGIWLVARVGPLVCCQVTGLGTGIAADVTDKGLVTRVSPTVYGQIAGCRAYMAAHGADKSVWLV